MPEQNLKKEVEELKERIKQLENLLAVHNHDGLTTPKLT